MRKCPNVESVLPVLYLKGLSANEFSQALKCLLGEGAKGLSKSTIHALRKSWDRDLKTWRQEKINDRFVYLWADGVWRNCGEKIFSYISEPALNFSSSLGGDGQTWSRGRHQQFQ